MGGFFATAFALAELFYMAAAGGIGIILGVSAVGDNKQLDIFIETASCPEAFPLVAVYLVKGFF